MCYFCLMFFLFLLLTIHYTTTQVIITASPYNSYEFRLTDNILDINHRRATPLVFRGARKYLIYINHVNLTKSSSTPSSWSTLSSRMLSAPSQWLHWLRVSTDCQKRAFFMWDHTWAYATIGSRKGNGN